MNDQLEHDLATAFGEHAGGAVDTDALAGAATRRGRRLRAWTSAVRGVAAAAAVAVVAAGTVAVWGPGGGTQVGGPSAQATSPTEVTRETTPPPGGWKVPRPRVVNVPPDPSKVGTDPTLLHFTVDDYTVDAESTTWSSQAGIESIAFIRDNAFYQVALAKTPDLLDLMWHRQQEATSDAGTPAEDRGGGLFVFTQGSLRGAYYLRWQPAAGLWAQVWGHGAGNEPASATAVKAKLRLDTTLRCTAPIQLRLLPAGAGLRGCAYTLTGYDIPGVNGRVTRLAESVLIVGQSPADQVEINTIRQVELPPPWQLTIAGHHAWTFLGNGDRANIEIPDYDGVRVELIGSGQYNQDLLVQLAEGITVAPVGEDPATWPERIVIP